jgi:hypothetical protein
MAAPTRIMITVTDESLDQLSSVATQLRGAGVNVEQTLDEVGMIIGTVDESKLESVSKIAGVAGVERDRTVTIAPPDSDVQ